MESSINLLKSSSFQLEDELNREEEKLATLLLERFRLERRIKELEKESKNEAPSNDQEKEFHVPVKRFYEVDIPLALIEGTKLAFHNLLEFDRFTFHSIKDEYFILAICVLEDGLIPDLFLEQWPTIFVPKHILQEYTKVEFLTKVIVNELKVGMRYTNVLDAQNYLQHQVDCAFILPSNKASVDKSRIFGAPITLYTQPEQCPKEIGSSLEYDLAYFSALLNNCELVVTKSNSSSSSIQIQCNGHPYEDLHNLLTEKVLCTIGKKQR